MAGFTRVSHRHSIIFSCTDISKIILIFYSVALGKSKGYVSGPQILYRPLVKELEVMCTYSFDEGRYDSVSIFRNTKPFPDQKLLSADRLNITFVAPGVKVGSNELTKELNQKENLKISVHLNYTSTEYDSGNYTCVFHQKDYRGNYTYVYYYYMNLTEVCNSLNSLPVKMSTRLSSTSQVTSSQVTPKSTSTSNPAECGADNSSMTVQIAVAVVSILVTVIICISVWSVRRRFCMNTPNTNPSALSRSRIVCDILLNLIRHCIHSYEIFTNNRPTRHAGDNRSGHPLRSLRLENIDQDDLQEAIILANTSGNEEHATNDDVPPSACRRPEDQRSNSTDPVRAVERRQSQSGVKKDFQMFPRISKYFKQPDPALVREAPVQSVHALNSQSQYVDANWNSSGKIINTVENVSAPLTNKTFPSNRVHSRHAEISNSRDVISPITRDHETAVKSIMPVISSRNNNHELSDHQNPTASRSDTFLKELAQEQELSLERSESETSIKSFTIVNQSSGAIEEWADTVVKDFVSDMRNRREKPENNHPVADEQETACKILSTNVSGSSDLSRMDPGPSNTFVKDLEPGYDTSNTFVKDLEPGHDTSNTYVKNLEPGHDTSNTFAKDLESGHDTSNTFVKDLEPGHDTSNTFVKDLEPGHDTSNTFAKNLEPGHDTSNTFAKDLESGHDTSNTFVKDLEPGHDTSNTFVKDLEPGHDTSNTFVKDLEPGHDTSNTYVKDLEPGHDTSNTFAKDLESGHDTSNTYVKDLEPGNDTSNTFAKDLEPGHDTSNTFVKDLEPGHDTSNTFVKDLEPGHDTSNTYVKDLEPGNDTSNTFAKDLESGHDTSNTYVKDLEPGHDTSNTFVKDLESGHDTSNTYVKDLESGHDTSNTFVKDLEPGHDTSNTFVKDLEPDSDTSTTISD